MQINNDDEFVWLENTYSPDALDWVVEENSKTEKKYIDNSSFRKNQKEIYEILTNDQNIPYIHKYRDYYYNFWQDDIHPQGIWRRTSLEEYQTENPKWEVVLDFDELGREENTTWFFQGSIRQLPESNRCLIKLSPDGGDAVEIREFDLDTKKFIQNGFYLKLAKNYISWINENEVFIATDFGEGSLTNSGYPRLVKRWKRGQSIDSAELIYSGKINDQSISADFHYNFGFKRNIIYRAKDFYHYESYLLKLEDNGYDIIPIPDDANIYFHKNWLLLRLKSDWELHQKYLTDSLIFIDFEEFMLGNRDFKIIFESTHNHILDQVIETKDYLILSVLDNVVNYLEVFDIKNNFKKIHSVKAPEDFSKIQVVLHENQENNNIFLIIHNFIKPTSFYLFNAKTAQLKLLKKEFEVFDSNKLLVTQHFVSSIDGTQIPYFQVSLKELEHNAQNPTQLYGYGGFEISLQPFYLGSLLKTWIAHGGVYVVANIRGGGEYGAKWHRAALKQNRKRAYEDFACVAQDLIHSKITNRKKLGAIGGSNGGLLIGNMLTQYPELFSALVCDVPLLDMKRYTEIGAGASWIAEYGDPNKPEEWAFIQHFSPYHNLQSHIDYPAVLYNTVTSDDRVSPVHARKMAARMKKIGIKNIYFYEQMKGGHSIFVNKKLSAFYLALVNEFFWNQLNS